MDDASILDRLDYDPNTGVFTWKSGKNAGKRAGSANGRKYRQINIGGRDFKYIKEHRLAFLFMTGSWPKGVVDHINWRTDDNRWENLRDVSIMFNCSHRNPENTRPESGQGVHFHLKKKLWESRATIAGRRVYLGAFESKSNALNARKIAIQSALKSGNLRKQIK